MSYAMLQCYSQSNVNDGRAQRQKYATSMNYISAPSAATCGMNFEVKAALTTMSITSANLILIGTEESLMAFCLAASASYSTSPR
eukprot:775333-Pleurochrysis_carterae.AAC.1